METLVFEPKLPIGVILPRVSFAQTNGDRLDGAICDCDDLPVVRIVNAPLDHIRSLKNDRTIRSHLRDDESQTVTQLYPAQGLDVAEVFQVTLVTFDEILTVVTGKRVACTCILPSRRQYGDLRV